jgi:hypothetical protein
LTLDSTTAILVTKKDDSEYYIRMFDLETQQMTFTERFGGDPKLNYIKMDDVIENSSGLFALAYFDDGMFKIRTFGKHVRDEEWIKREEYDVNKAIGINNHTLANNGNCNPYINIVFFTDSKILVNLFYNKTFTHYHFIYDLNKRDHEYKDYEIFRTVLTGTSMENFPLKSVYNDENDEFTCFYRLGQVITFSAKTIAKEVSIETLD